MVRLLTKQDVLKHRKKVNKWWKELDNFSKEKIYWAFKGIIEQIKCEHEFRETTFYDEKGLSCKKCLYTIIKPKNKKQ